MYYQDEAGRKLEIEMQKRRERIEKWRQERKKKEASVTEKIEQTEKKWTLDNEEEDDEGDTPQDNQQERK